MSGLRVMCYVQHLMGIGHQRRMAAISRALCASGQEVTYVSGGFPLPDLRPGEVRFVQLPPARSADLTYKRLVGEDGAPVTEQWRASRRQILLEAFDNTQPDVLIIETFPFGRRMLRFELLPLLQTAQRSRRRPLILSSIRDILEHRDSEERNSEVLEYLTRHFDFVLVHSDPSLVPLEASFSPAPAIDERIRYTGYVLDAPDGHTGTDAGTGEVIVSTGGGGYGEHILRCATESRALSGLSDATWRILAGNNLPEERFDRLRASAPTGVIVERNRPDFLELLRNCRLSISQGGYNTVLELVAAGTRAIVIPYRDEREREQATRAQLLARKGLIHVVDNNNLNPATLARAVDAALLHAAPAPACIDTNGAEKTAEIVLGLVKSADQHAQRRLN